jgi:hypothetical protein
VAKLIAAYGEWWDPHEVEWGSAGPGNKGRLLGFEKGKREPVIDVWEQVGIYVLFQDWSVVYVGKTGAQPLGRRLKQHRVDDVAGRWDRFSWFGVRPINNDGSLRSTKALSTRQLSGDDVIDTLEGALIRVTAPALNYKRERVPDAKSLIQAAPPARDVRAQLADMERELRAMRTAIERVAPLAD